MALVVELLAYSLILPAFSDDIAEVALVLLGRAQGFGPRLDDFRLVDHAIAEASVVRPFVDNHGVLHVVACVRDHSNDRVGPLRVRIAFRTFVHRGAHDGLLWGEDPVHFVVAPVNMVVVRRAHRLFQHLALVHVPRTLVVVRERRERGKQRKYFGRAQLFVGVFHRELFRDFFATVNPVGECDTGKMPLNAKRRDIKEKLLDGADILDLASSKASHWPHQAARRKEKVQPREKVLPRFRDAHDLHVLRHPLLLTVNLQAAYFLRKLFELLKGHVAHWASIQGNPSTRHAGARSEGRCCGRRLAGPTRNLRAQGREVPNDAFEHLRRVALRHTLARVCQMVQQTAWSTIWRVHRTQEAPSLGKQLSHRRGFHLREVLPTVRGDEVGTEARCVQLVRHNRVT
mmetsp:Transcript_70093/g.194877  ORF Transcript_70093/g.194877 Transcript_70093/m.194877 type:complete len:401 (+) Transcript_70093:1336-2538(+)